MAITKSEVTTYRQRIDFNVFDLAHLAMDQALSDGNGFIGEPANVVVTSVRSERNGEVGRDDIDELDIFMENGFDILVTVEFERVYERGEA